LTGVQQTNKQASKQASKQARSKNPNAHSTPPVIVRLLEPNVGQSSQRPTAWPLPQTQSVKRYSKAFLTEICNSEKKTIDKKCGPGRFSFFSRHSAIYHSSGSSGRRAAIEERGTSELI